MGIAPIADSGMETDLVGGGPAGWHPEPEALVSTGEEAVSTRDWPAAMECLRRLDPCTEAAERLRARVESAEGCPIAVPKRPDGMLGDPVELAAQVFLAAIDPKRLAIQLFSLGRAGIIVLVLGIAGAWVPGEAGGAIAAATLAGFLVWILRTGLVVREQAWLHPGREVQAVTGEAMSERRRTLAAATTAMLLVAAPVVLGLGVGFGWTLVLSPVFGMLALFVLISDPLQVLGHGYPFAVPPTAEELRAVFLAGLLVSAGSVAVGFLAWIGGVAGLGALVLSFATWMFVLRGSGLLARRIHYRLAAAQAAATPMPRPTRSRTGQASD